MFSVPVLCKFALQVQYEFEAWMAHISHNFKVLEILLSLPSKSKNMPFLS